MITLVQNIQLRFYKNSEDLRMFREEVEIGVMWARAKSSYALHQSEAITILPAPIRGDHGSPFCLHQSEAITDHCSACTNHIRS